MSKADEFIREHTRNCSNLMQVPTLDDKGNIVPEAHPWLTPDEARRAVEIAREELKRYFEWKNNKAVQQRRKEIINYKQELQKLVDDKKIHLKAAKRFKDDKVVGLVVQWKGLYKIAEYFYELGCNSSKPEAPEQEQ